MYTLNTRNIEEKLKEVLDLGCKFAGPELGAELLSVTVKAIEANTTLSDYQINLRRGVQDISAAATIEVEKSKLNQDIENARSFSRGVQAGVVIGSSR